MSEQYYYFMSVSVIDISQNGIKNLDDCYFLPFSRLFQSFDLIPMFRS
jgi:hypothetical protein